MGQAASAKHGFARSSWTRALVAMLVGAWILVASIHLVIPPGHRSLVWPFGYLLLEILTTVSLGYRAWLTRGNGRLAWWLLACSAFLDVINVSLMALTSLNSAPMWASGQLKWLSLVTGILVLVGILQFPRGKEQEGGDRRRLLDGLLFAVSVLFLLWVAGIHGALWSAAHRSLGLRVMVAYLNAALMGGGLIFLTSNQPHRYKGPLGWLAASALAWLLVLSGWAMAGLPLAPEILWWWPLVGGIPLFQGLAACAPPPNETTAVSTGMDRLARLLPYLPVAVALGVMAVLVFQAPLSILRGASALFLVMVVVLIFRQLQAIQDIELSRRSLEMRVQERTQSLEQAQQTLLRTERMNTLAMMGAGLAHDLNNLLGAVKASAELALMNIEEGNDPCPEDLNRIMKAADRAALLTRRLMEFARREDEDLSPLDLGHTSKEIEATLRLLLPRSVTFSLEVASSPPLIVMSSRLRLEQMMVNLVANARDAMPSGGSLGIRVSRGGPVEDQALIEVTDSGTGMSPEVLARIFDPFYTTKEPGKGTGLGLSSLKAMVEDGGGQLSAESEPGRGTRFLIQLPLVSGVGFSPR